MCVSVTKCCRTVRKNETRKENKKLVEGAERNDGGRSERRVEDGRRFLKTWWD